MKYLKSIFESRSDQDLTELHDTCEMYLAYLIDSWFYSLRLNQMRWLVFLILILVNDI
jgi:hypothetical protein